MDKRRSGLRRRLLKAGTISFNQTCVISCTVRNMSDAGASLEVPSPLGIPDDFTLVIESEQFLVNVMCDGAPQTALALRSADIAR